MWIAFIALVVVIAAVFLWEKLVRKRDRAFFQEGPVQPDTHPTPPREKL